MKALICLHGLLSSSKDFKLINERLKNFYDKIICYDLPGHGLNSIKFNSKNIKKFLIDIYDSIADKYSDIDLIGYSMGGVMASYLQSVRKINHLILLAPSYNYLNLKNYHKKNNNKTAIKKLIPKKNYLHIIKFPIIMSNLIQEFKIIYPKTLIIWGKDDYLVKESSGIVLYNMIKNQNKYLLELPSHNHFNIVKSEVVIKYIKLFIIS